MDQAVLIIIGNPLLAHRAGRLHSPVHPHHMSEWKEKGDNCKTISTSRWRKMSNAVKKSRTKTASLLF
jgi:hypothetical protein